MPEPTMLALTGDPLYTFATSRQYRVDPYPFLAGLRRTSPVHRSTAGFCLLTRYEDVARALRDPALGTASVTDSPQDGAVAGIAEAIRRGVTRPVSALDPPEHGRVRRALAGAFPRDLFETLREPVERRVDELLDGLPAGEVVDAVSALALPLPLAVVCDLLGVPDRDREALASWGSALAANGDPGFLLAEEHRGAALRAERDLGAYFGRLLVRRRHRPDGGPLAALIAAGDGTDRLAFHELMANSAFLFVNGYHNTVNLISLGLLALLRNPDQYARLGAEPDLAPAAVEELLRFDSPIQSIARVARERYEVGGAVLPPGTQVMAMVGAAHRDPEAFEEPDRLDLGRRSSRRALSFGGGVHYCLGAAVARMEVEVLLRETARRFPDLALAGAPEWSSTFTLRGLDLLPVRLGKRRREG
ncbi:cytochrome P450 [Micromonospora sp. CPCC 206061]|uniref:cytochrome P450 n=1 Tax=Micromonospora sp. CPCC 206061 TaxID=3122410 RepID=UPI002FF39EEF